MESEKLDGLEEVWIFVAFLIKPAHFWGLFYLLKFTGVCCNILRHLPSDVGRSRWNDSNPSKRGSVTPINQKLFLAIRSGGCKTRYIKPYVKWPKPCLIAAYPWLISLYWGDTRRAPLCLPKLINLSFRWRNYLLFELPRTENTPWHLGTSELFFAGIAESKPSKSSKRPATTCNIMFKWMDMFFSNHFPYTKWVGSTNPKMKAKNRLDGWMFQVSYIFDL